MDKFEYGLAIVKSRPSEKDKVKNGFLYQLVFELTTYEADGTPNVHSEDIEGATFIEHEIQGDWHPDYDPIWGGRGRVVRDLEWHSDLRSNDLTKAIMPYLAKLGSEGWEVTEYKFSTEKSFAQAMLKRKIQ